MRRIRLAWPRGTNFCSAEIINLNALLRRMFHNTGRNIYPEKWLQIGQREREVTRIVEYLKFFNYHRHSSFYQPARSKVVAVNIWLSQICEKIAYQLSILNENILFVFEVSQPQTCQVTTTFIVLRLKPCVSSVQKKDSLFLFHTWHAGCSLFFLFNDAIYRNRSTPREPWRQQWQSDIVVRMLFSKRFETWCETVPLSVGQI